MSKMKVLRCKEDEIHGNIDHLKKVKSTSRYRKPWQVSVNAISEEESQGPCPDKPSPRGIDNSLMLRGKLDVTKDATLEGTTLPADTQAVMLSQDEELAL